MSIVDALDFQAGAKQDGGPEAAILFTITC
jgi:hypothetical protein